MEHLRLDKRTVETAVGVDEFRNRWRAFLRADDRVAMQHHGTADLLRSVDADFVPTVILKAVNVPASLKTNPEANPTPEGAATVAVPTAESRSIARAILASVPQIALRGRAERPRIN